MIELSLILKSFTIYRKAIKSALTILNPEEVKEIEEIEEIKEKKEVLTGIIINTAINRPSIATIVIRVIRRVFTFIKINIFISIGYRLIDFFLSSL